MVLPRTVYFLSTINLLSFLDRFLLQAVLPLVVTDFSLTNTQGGYLVSAFVVGYLIFSPIFGYLGDRCRRPPLLALGVLLWSVATFLSGAASSYPLLLFSRVLVGIGEASFVTICPGYIRDRMKEPILVNRSLAVFAAAMPVGAALGYAVGAMLARSLSWHGAFLVGGVPGVLLSILVSRMPEVGRTEGTKPPTLQEGVRELRGISILRFAIIGYVFNNFALVGVSAFVAKHGVGLGFSNEAIGIWFGTILLVTGFIGSLGGGALSSRLAKSAVSPIHSLLNFVGTTALIGAPLLGAGLMTNDRSTFLVFCFLAQLAILAGIAPLNSVLVLSSPARLVALVQGVTIALINLFGSFLSPIVIGIVGDHTSLRTGMQCCTVALAISGCIWLIGARKVDKI